MTPIVKLTTIIETLTGNRPTSELPLKVANAFLDSLDDDQVLETLNKPRADVTNAEKASLALESVRNFIQNKVRYAPQIVASRQPIIPADVSGL